MTVGAVVALSVTLAACTGPWSLWAGPGQPVLDSMRITASGVAADLTPFPVTVNGLQAMALWQAAHRLPRSPTGTSSCGASSGGTYDVVVYHQAVAEGSLVVAFGACGGGVTLSDSYARWLSGPDAADIDALLAEALSLSEPELAVRSNGFGYLSGLPGWCRLTAVQTGSPRFRFAGAESVPRTLIGLGDYNSAATGSIYGFLSFGQGGDTTLKARQAMKVLWVVPDAFARGDRLDIAGVNLNSGATYGASFPAAGNGEYPSLLDLPSPGCWRLTVRAGTSMGVATLQTTGQ